MKRSFVIVKPTSFLLLPRLRKIGGRNAKAKSPRLGGPVAGDALHVNGARRDGVKYSACRHYLWYKLLMIGWTE